MKCLPFDEKDFKKLDLLIRQEERFIYGQKRAEWLAESRKNQKAKREAVAAARGNK